MAFGKKVFLIIDVSPYAVEIRPDDGVAYYINDSYERYIYDLNTGARTSVDLDVGTFWERHSLPIKGRCMARCRAFNLDFRDLMI